MNEAARLETVAKRRDLEMIVSQPVLDRAADTLDRNAWRDLGEETLAGASAPVRIYADGGETGKAA